MKGDADDEECLLARPESRYGVEVLMNKAQQEQRCRDYSYFSLGLVCGLALSIVLVLFFAACQRSDIVRDGSSTSPPLDPVGTMVFQVEVDALEIGSDGWEDSVMIKESRPQQQQQPSAPSNASCGVTEADRFDCWPEFLFANQAECELRGCCWNPSLDNNVPFCFYPTG
jgi:hypothetical protein